VLAESGEPMNCQERIGAMAGKGYWTSPNGKTPGETLYSAMTAFSPYWLEASAVAAFVV
jgi:hypothetical protein